MPAPSSTVPSDTSTPSKPMESAHRTNSRILPWTQASSRSVPPMQVCTLASRQATTLARMWRLT